MGERNDLTDPDMSNQQMRLYFGEMTAQEMRTARAAIRFANSRAATTIASLSEALAEAEKKVAKDERPREKAADEADIESLSDEIIEAIDDSLDEGWSPAWARRGIEKVLRAALILGATTNEALLTSAEQKTQAGRCACRGFDDMCVCQNVPDRQTKEERAGRASPPRDLSQGGQHG